jgi:hypothetical protein
VRTLKKLPLVRLKLAATAAIVAGVVVAAGASAAVASSGSSAPQSVARGPVSQVVAEATWGVQNGKPFMRLVKGQLVGRYNLNSIKVSANTPVPSAAAAAASCTEYISNVSKALGDVPFYWVTQQTCTGAFGYQWMSTQMWRSSYRGPLGYGGWATTPEQTASEISRNWDIGCNYGTGSYTYYPVMYGAALNIGQGPTIRSANQINTANCGTTPP